MKIGIAQVNLKIGALEQNASKIADAAKDLAGKGCELIVFPELAVTGYYPWDLLEQPGFVEEQLRVIDRLAMQTAGLNATIILGAATIADGPLPGKPFRNSALVLRGGEIIASGHKQLLPTYNIFDERRHFEPGTETLVIEHAGKRFAILICEDAWNDDQTQYSVNPILGAVESRVDAILSINASPWQLDKHQGRLDLFSKVARHHGLPLLYVNQVGGHDEIIYDGSSFAVSPAGVTWQGAFAQEQIAEIAFEDGSFTGPAAQEWPAAKADQQLRMIELGLRDYMSKCGFSKVVIGSSGGIDSAVTMALAERVLGAQNVMPVTMPSKYSSEGSVSDSQEICDRLELHLRHISIKDGFDVQMQAFASAFDRAPARVAIENTQARLRGLALMTISNDSGALLLTTGNKSEVSVGYCTLYGDMSGGLNLIGDLYKTEVYDLARHLNAIDPRGPIPVGIIDKAPSAELFEDQKDSDSLPPYDELDAILRLYLERDLLSALEIEQAWTVLTAHATSDAAMEKIMGMVDRAEFKRWQACPILRMHARAFGTGRRYPIAQGFKPKAAILRMVSAKPLNAKN